MGRLFWKFFAFIWLAQLGGIVAIGSILLPARADRADIFDVGRDPARGNQTHIAAEILKYAGEGAFADWSRDNAGSTVYAIDESQHELLRRAVPDPLLKEARASARANPRPPWVQEVKWSSHRYLVFGNDTGNEMARRPLAKTGTDPEPASPRQSIPPSSIGPRALPGPKGALLFEINHSPLPVLPTLATLGASLITAFLLAWYVAKPLRILRSGFEIVATGNLTLQIAPAIGRRKDEIADLARDFDRMTARLAATMTALRRLLHDVSHEIRSPLARLQAAVGLLRQSITTLPAVIERIEEEIDRIDRLLGDLLQLSRLEAGEHVDPEELIDIGEVVLDAVTDADFEAQASGRSVLLTNQISAQGRGSPKLLHAALDNVLRNALKHAPESRIVEVATALDTTRGRYTISISDYGPGVPEHDIPNLFTPFFRCANVVSEGAGLGLSIARRSVEVLGGCIVARNLTDGGLLVEIELPVDDAHPQKPDHWELENSNPVF